ncbi:MAG: DUF58 domain-containing protein [Terrimesophilobacter sp.]
MTLRGSGMLGAAIALFSVAYIAGWPELLILASFCAIPPLLALLVVAVKRPRWAVKRSLSRSVVSVGSLGSARVTVRSTARRRSSSARWSDDLPWSPGRTEWQELPAVNAGTAVELHYDFSPPRRGVALLGPVVVERADPFGFARSEWALGERQRVVVAPELVDLALGLTDLATHTGAAQLFHHRALAGDHDIMTRDYRAGDAMGRVHWKASAHHGQLMVREDDKRSHAEAAIVVDTRRGSWRDVSRSQSFERVESEGFEWALSMTSSLRDFFVRSGLRVRTVETAVTQLADAANVDDFVESLARVRLSYHDGPAIRLAEPAKASVGSVFAVLNAPDEETIRALTEQRAGFGFAAAFMLGARDAVRNDRLLRAGWVLHHVSEGESVLAAWHGLLAMGAVADGAVAEITAAADG